jgi:hypothetical protein
MFQIAGGDGVYLPELALLTAYTVVILRSRALARRLEG